MAEREQKKSMEGLRCQPEGLGLIWQAVGSYQGCKQFRDVASKTEQRDAGSRVEEEAEGSGRRAGTQAE